jgi:hypothetical protein
MGVAPLVLERLCELRSYAGGPSAWVDENWAVMERFHLDDAAYPVPRRFCDGDRWDDPPWPPLLKGGKLCATFAVGDYRSSDRDFSTAYPNPRPSPRGRESEHFEVADTLFAREAGRGELRGITIGGIGGIRCGCSGSGGSGRLRRVLHTGRRGERGRS